MSKGKTISFVAAQDTKESIEQFSDENEQTRSKACEQLIQEALASRGYRTDDGPLTVAQRLIRNVQIGLCGVGMTMLVLSVISDTTFLGAAIGVFVACLSLRVSEWVILPRVEPRLSESIPKVTINVK